MLESRIFITCPKRGGGRHRVPPEVCRSCEKHKTCVSWRNYLNPPLFPENAPVLDRE